MHSGLWQVKGLEFVGHLAAVIDASDQYREGRAETKLFDRQGLAADG